MSPVPDRVVNSTRNRAPDVKGGEAVVVRRWPGNRPPLTEGEMFRRIQVPGQASSLTFSQNDKHDIISDG